MYNDYKLERIINNFDYFFPRNCNLSILIITFSNKFEGRKKKKKRK